MEFLTATAPVIFGLMDAKFGRRRRRDVKFGGFSVKLGAASVKFYLAEAALCGTIKEVRLYHTCLLYTSRKHVLIFLDHRLR